MGRPLKTYKYNDPVDVDLGFPNDGSTDNGYDTNNPGVTGGYDGYIRVTANVNLPGAGTITAATNSTAVVGVGTQFDYSGLNTGSPIYVNGVEIGTVDSIANATHLTLDANSASNVSAGAFTFDTTEVNGYILRQKGKRKFMVALSSTIQDEGIAAGGKYFINYAGDTDWNALGAGPDAGYGKIFTASSDGAGLSTGGAVNIVDVCTLVDGSPNAGEMVLEVYNDGNTTNACSITNHWVRDFENNAEPLDDNAVNTKYIATIFNNNGDVDPATNYTIVAVENWC